MTTTGIACEYQFKMFQPTTTVKLLVLIALLVGCAASQREFRQYRGEYDGELSSDYDTPPLGGDYNGIRRPIYEESADGFDGGYGLGPDIKYNTSLSRRLERDRLRDLELRHSIDLNLRPKEMFCWEVSLVYWPTGKWREIARSEFPFRCCDNDILFIVEACWNPDYSGWPDRSDWSDWRSTPELGGMDRPGRPRERSRTEALPRSLINPMRLPCGMVALIYWPFLWQTIPKSEFPFSCCSWDLFKIVKACWEEDWPFPPESGENPPSRPWPSRPARPAGKPPRAGWPDPPRGPVFIPPASPASILPSRLHLNAAGALRDIKLDKRLQGKTRGYDGDQLSFEERRKINARENLQEDLHNPKINGSRLFLNYLEEEEILECFNLLVTGNIYYQSPEKFPVHCCYIDLFAIVDQCNTSAKPPIKSAPFSSTKGSSQKSDTEKTAASRRPEMTTKRPSKKSTEKPKRPESVPFSSTSVGSQKSDRKESATSKRPERTTKRPSKKSTKKPKKHKKTTTMRSKSKDTKWVQ